MKKNIFTPANILLPQGISMEKWSVVACDQFSSERDYWERVGDIVGEEPSTLKMIIPEAFLEELDEAEETKKISATMGEYLDSGLFYEVSDSFIYLERTQPDGRVRQGLVGAIDLDCYDFTGTASAVRASEGTVLDRLPPRISIRRTARLELPHIMTFIDDPGNTVLGQLAQKADSLQPVYDFNLMEGGGHIKAMRVAGGDAEAVMASINALNDESGMLMVMGDGNHSLAAAKVYWEELKKTLSEDEAANHPASKALVELNNVYDGAIDFEAIHRVLFDVDPAKFVDDFTKAMQPGTDYIIRWVSEGKKGEIGIGAQCIGDMLSAMQDFLDDYAKSENARIDYIHGEDSVMKLADCKNNVGLVLPAMVKSEFFETVAARGVFPKKSFSVGHAKDKRYYLECRGIK
ncbi:MAG: DUF1015 domain-containing protein [Oscillospiraceae bacterium]|nr:DUF1015 domain-containing protein [Oscillospiraceae bacterium]